MPHWLGAGLLALFLVPGIPVRGERPPTPDVCTYGDWSKPRFVEAVRWGGLLRAVEVVQRGGSQFVFANDVPTLEIPTDRHPLVAVQLPDRKIGRPAGDFLFVYPRAAVGPDGVLHMVWAEPDDPPDSDKWGDWTHTSVWYARHEAPRGWSDAVEVLRADRISWEMTGRAMAVDSAGRVHVIVQVGGDLLGDALHVVRADSAWQRSRIDDTFLYPALTAGPGGRLYLAYINAGGTGNPNSVFLRSSADGGRSWSEPNRVYASGGRQAFRLDALRSADGRLHLIWQDNGQGFRHTSSADGGRTWSDLDDVAFRQGILAHDAVLDRCGTVHVVFETLALNADGEPRMRLRYVRWQGGWSAPVRLFPDVPHSFAPGLTVDARGRPTLYFSGGRAMRPDTAQIGGFVSRLEVHE